MADVNAAHAGLRTRRPWTPAERVEQRARGRTGQRLALRLRLRGLTGLSATGQETTGVRVFVEDRMRARGSPEALHSLTNVDDALMPVRCGC